MIGLGTLYNALGVVFGGLLGLLIGQRLSEDFHETLLKVTGVAVFVLGIAGTLEKMLVVHGSHVESHGSMMLILSLVIGTVIGELLKIEEGFERLGTWLKEKTGNQGDTSFVDAFMTTALTICIGAMAVVGAVQDGLTGDTSTLLAKAILDMVIVLVLTVSKGKGAIFAVIPLVILQGLITLLAHLIATDHDPTSPFESVPSWLQPHSLCRDQPHLGQTNQGRQSPASSADCHYLGFCWLKNRS